MAIHTAQCFYKGHVFFGTFEITGVGSHESIDVRYDGNCIRADIVGLRAEIVAPTLLRELVMEQAATNVPKPVGK